MKTIAFFVRHFTERGTEIAIYDYAHYNETILGNKSYIVCFTPEAQASIGFPLITLSYAKFAARFQVFQISSMRDMTNLIREFGIDVFYTLTHGGHENTYEFDNPSIWGSCKTIKHCVFDTRVPQADVHITISNHLNKRFGTQVPVLPHMVYLPPPTMSLRSQLGIPENAFVFGRHGGLDTFDNSTVHKAIIKFLVVNRTTYFVFMNTKVFYNHPRILYLPMTTDSQTKANFVHTCDAMIHGRIEGETFGLAVGEFSFLNKPVVTSRIGDLEHLEILGNQAIVFENGEHLVSIFSNIRSILHGRIQWNAYKRYSPESVMKTFGELI